MHSKRHCDCNKFKIQIVSMQNKGCWMQQWMHFLTFFIQETSNDDNLVLIIGNWFILCLCGVEMMNAKFTAKTKQPLHNSFFMRALSWLFIVTYISQPRTNGETLVYDATNTPQDVIQCVDPSSECIINCVGDEICELKEIHCHNKSTTSLCKLNFNGSQRGVNVFIYTHTSPIIFINATGSHALHRSVIYGHETMNTKLYIYAFTPYFRRLVKVVYYQ